MRLHPGNLHEFLILHFKGTRLVLLFGHVEREPDELIGALIAVTLNQDL